MALKVWIDGRLYDKDDAKISVYDHGLLYGDGVFEGIRVYNGRIFECDAHIDRLWASAKAVRMTIPLSREQVRSAMEETQRRSRPAGRPRSSCVASSAAPSSSTAGRAAA